MADLLRIKQNVAKMVGAGAPDDEIDEYIAQEGSTVDEVRSFKTGSQKVASLRDPISNAIIPAMAKGALSFANTSLMNVPRMMSPEIDRQLKGENLGEQAAINIGGLAGLISPIGVGARIAKGVVGGVAKKFGTGTGANIAGMATAGAVENALYGTEKAEDYLNPQKVAERAGIGAAFGAGIPAVVGGASAAIRGVGRGVKAMPAKLINEIIRPADKELRYSKNPSRAILEEGITTTDVLTLDDFQRKVNTRKEEIGQQIANEYASTKGVFNIKDALLGKARAEINRLSKSPNSNRTAIARVQDFIDDVRGWKADGLSASEAWNVMRNVGEMAKWTGNSSDDKIGNEVVQSAYRNVSAMMQRANPKLTKLNQKYGDFLTASTALRKRASVVEKNNIIPPSAVAGGIATVFGSVATGGLNLGALASGAAVAGGTKLWQSPMFKTNLAKALNSASVQEIADVMAKSPRFKDIIGSTFGKPVNDAQSAKSVAVEAEIIDQSTPRLPRPADVDVTRGTQKADDLTDPERFTYTNEQGYRVAEPKVQMGVKGEMPKFANQYAKEITAQTKALPSYKDPSLRGTAPVTKVTSGGISENAYNFAKEQAAPVEMPSVLRSDVEASQKARLAGTPRKLPAPESIYGKDFIIEAPRKITFDKDSGKAIFRPSENDKKIISAMREVLGEASKDERLIAREAENVSGVRRDKTIGVPSSFPEWSKKQDGNAFARDYIEDLFDRIENGKPMTEKMVNDAQSMIEKAHRNIGQKGLGLSFTEYDNIRTDNFQNKVPSGEPIESIAYDKTDDLGAYEVDFGEVDAGTPWMKKGSMNLGGAERSDIEFQFVKPEISQYIGGVENADDIAENIIGIIKQARNDVKSTNVQSLAKRSLEYAKKDWQDVKNETMQAKEFDLYQKTISFFKDMAENQKEDFARGIFLPTARRAKGAKSASMNLGGSDDALLTEARKYKSAEEFVKAQGDIVYHGTEKKFDKFKTESESKNDSGLFGGQKTNRTGAFFSDNKEYAKEFGPNLHEAIVYVKNPLILRDTRADALGIADEIYGEDGLFKNPKKLKKFYDEVQFNYEPWYLLEGDFGKDLKKYAEANGYDGVKFYESNLKKDHTQFSGISQDKEEIGGNTIVAFNPDQIKTKSQLTDIWNQAHGKTKQAMTAPVVPATYAGAGAISVAVANEVKKAKTAKELNDVKKKHKLTSEQVNKIRKGK